VSGLDEAVRSAGRILDYVGEFEGNFLGHASSRFGCYG